MRIEVYDNGPGIDPDRREDIFLPFYTTRPDGNGVGLSFARQVIIAHGGTITAARLAAWRRIDNRRDCVMIGFVSAEG